MDTEAEIYYGAKIRLGLDEYDNILISITREVIIDAISYRKTNTRCLISPTGDLNFLSELNKEQLIRLILGKSVKSDAFESFYRNGKECPK